jgi:hypothetical protein
MSALLEKSTEAQGRAVFHLNPKDRRDGECNIEI